MSARVLIALCTLALLGPAVVPASSAADVFGPISLASESAVQQADYARDAAISGDGRYVAFDGSFGGVAGVWRRDLQSGGVELVAGGDAELPSISSDGRYVSFTTTAPLTPGDTNKGPDVYVRDMDMPSAPPCLAEEARPCEFTLASAVDGGEEVLSYGASEDPTKYGSRAAGRTALSADGRTVAFVTTAVSDLIGPRPPASPATPAMQVAVRNLDTRRTQLVSVTSPAGAEPQPVVSEEEAGRQVGAVYSEGDKAPPFTPSEPYGASEPFGVSISGDGSTVAWMGVNVAEQVPALSGEIPIVRYAEPLWRRIADAPLAPTRQVAGGADPLAPQCIASGETALSLPPSLADPCQGPFSTRTEPADPGVWQGGAGDVVPRLSADGYTIAFLADAPLVAAGANFGRSENHSDAYVADMHEGLTRAEALRPLTELAGGQSQDLATNAPIIDLGISPDGTQVAFTTKRTVFQLGVPAYVSAPAAVPGMVELFDADLANQTLTRVTHGFEGGASEHPHETKATGEDPYFQPSDGALSPSFSANGRTLAFSSTAANLVYGDGNTPPLGHSTFDGSDAFVVSRLQFGANPPEAYVSPAPPEPLLVPAWRLGATARSLRDGSVLLSVEVPAAGLLRTFASGAIAVRAGGASAHTRRARTSITTRVVASRSVGAGGAGLETVLLKLAPRYAALARRRGGLEATVSLLFTAAGHPPLRESLEVDFAGASHATHARARRGAVRHARRRR